MYPIPHLVSDPYLPRVEIREEFENIAGSWVQKVRGKECDPLHHRRVVAALNCVKALCPGLDASGKRRIVNQILTVSDGKDRSVPRQQITDAQVTEMVWRHMQCITRRCPMLLFGKQLAEEINEFFAEDE
jgi:hypothetical protein